LHRRPQRLSAFEEKLDRQAREPMARIRMEGGRLTIPYVASAFSDEDGFVSPDEAARRMGVTTAELLRLANLGGTCTRHGLRVRPALRTGSALSTTMARIVRPRSVERDRALSGDERPHVRVAEDG
jgi:hypothetical protein